MGDSGCEPPPLTHTGGRGPAPEFGSFATAVRLIDDGEYWVQIKGFQDCDPAAGVVKCAQRP